MECRAMAFVLFRPQISTMCADDGLTDCQTKAQTLWLGGVECLEDFVPVLAQTMAIVPHGKSQPRSLVHAGERQCFFP